MGSELERRGFSMRLPLWSAQAVMDAPELVKQIHKDYLKAGAQALTTATFRTTRHALGKEGMPSRARELTERAVELAREAVMEVSADLEIIIAGSIAPLEDCYMPELAPDDTTMIQEFTHSAFLLKEAGADVLLVETQNSRREAHLATAAALTTGIPVWVALMPRSMDRMYNGDSLEETAKLVHHQGALAVLVNCCAPQIALAAHATVQNSVREAKTGAYPNILAQKMLPSEFARWAKGLAAQGAHIVGGCCGTTPEHISAAARILRA